MTTKDKAAVLLSTAIDFMAQKAGVPPQDIVAVIADDRTGNTARYLAQLLTHGIEATA